MTWGAGCAPTIKGSCARLSSAASEGSTAVQNSATAVIALVTMLLGLSFMVLSGDVLTISAPDEYFLERHDGVRVATVAAGGDAEELAVRLGERLSAHLQTETFDDVA